jgi:drug/metabolite transporter (DMT)-like permease
MKRWQPYLLLALANLFWAGNWVIGRALRESWSPVTLNFWRWLLAALILAPFALPLLKGKWPLLRRHAVLLLVLAFTGGALFQSLIYLGLRSTAVVNAVLINSSAPLFILLCSWVLQRDRFTARQLAGVLLSAAGIVIILGRGDIGVLLHLDFHMGDALILLAMPVWGIYSVLLKRVPAELRGSMFLFTVAALTVPMLLGPMLLESRQAPARPLDAAAIAGLGYVALFASVLAFTCWNRAVAMVGANVAGFSMPLLPAFGTVLAMVFLGETLQPFHVAGIATILAGFALASTGASRSRAAAPATPAGPAAPPA